MLNSFILFYKIYIETLHVQSIMKLTLQLCNNVIFQDIAADIKRWWDWTYVSKRSQSSYSLLSQMLTYRLFLSVLHQVFPFELHTQTSFFEHLQLTDEIRYEIELRAIAHISWSVTCGDCDRKMQLFK